MRKLRLRKRFDRVLHGGRTLADSADFPRLQQHNTYLGPFGLLFFLWGLVDWIVDLSFCYSLWHCQQPVLAGCVTVSLLVTTAMTWYLGWYTLKFIVRTDRRVPSPAREWVARSPVFGPMIVVGSSSRLNSMAILRLRLCGRMLIDFPDSPDHRFFHFMRNAGERANNPDKTISRSSSTDKTIN